MDGIALDVRDRLGEDHQAEHRPGKADPGKHDPVAPDRLGA